MIRRLSISVTLCAALTGCGKSPLSQSQRQSLAASPASNASERRETAPERRETATAPAPQNPRDFGALFANEAAHRPTGTIKADEALAAFRRDGVELNTVRQHLARPYGARYCVGAMSGTTLALSVCEYVDPEAAQAGAETSRKILLANREIRISQATSLTVRALERTPATDALAQRLFDRFAKL